MIWRRKKYDPIPEHIIKKYEKKHGIIGEYERAQKSFEERQEAAKEIQKHRELIKAVKEQAGARKREYLEDVGIGGAVTAVTAPFALKLYTYLQQNPDIASRRPELALAAMAPFIGLALTGAALMNTKFAPGASGKVREHLSKLKPREIVMLAAAINHIHKNGSIFERRIANKLAKYISAYMYEIAKSTER
jgi:hypothetical protein